jgi:hypothetical protein
MYIYFASIQYVHKLPHNFTPLNNIIIGGTDISPFLLLHTDWLWSAPSVLSSGYWGGGVLILLWRVEQPLCEADHLSSSIVMVKNA